MTAVRRVLPLAATAVAAAVTAATGLSALSACEPERVAGCTVPLNEGALLDAYAHDAVFEVRPDGARPEVGPVRTQACHRVEPRDVSGTGVSLVFSTDRPYDTRALAAAYDEVAVRGGWSRAADGAPTGKPPHYDALVYCRLVLGMVSRLAISAQPPSSMDVRPSTTDRPSEPVWQVARGSLGVSIYAEPGATSCR
jgi:hypothetical protein